MKIEIHHRCANFNSYRAARVKSLFNVESGADFRLSVELPLHERPWQIGVVAGPSGSGKTSIGKSIGQAYAPKWPANRPLVDAIATDGDFDAVTAALSSVGLGDVPAWLRPYRRPLRTLINTSHPGLAAALRRNPQWTQVSAALYGADKLRCRDSLRRSALKHGKDTGKARSTTGYGGHFRAVQGFRYLGNGQEE